MMPDLHIRASPLEVSTISRQAQTYPVALPDLTLQVTEWPGNCDPVLLIHATGFHSRCWDSIARQLDGLHIFAVDARFHGGSDRHGVVDWKLMAGDFAALLERLDLHRVVAAGHSMGGYITAYLGAMQPERFKQLVLIDPVILSPEQYEKDIASRKRIDPADSPVTKRKNHWRDSEEMYQRFKDRKPFNTWKDEILRDYCNYGLRAAPDESAYQLACDPLHEAAMYVGQRGSSTIIEKLPLLTMPITVMRGRRDPTGRLSLDSSPTWPGLADALPQARDMFLPQLSHFIPMEDPELVAKVIREAVTESWEVR